MSRIPVAVLLVLIIMIAGFFGVREFLKDENITSDNSGFKGSNEGLSEGMIVREPSSSNRQVYINQEWRFSFEYPTDWNIRTPAFGSRASLFNMEITPEGKYNFPNPVLINITPKWWIERLLPEIETQRNYPATSLIDGRSAIVGSFISHSVIEAKQYFILVNDEYWYDISGQIQAGEVLGYEEELEIVRSTFQFHEPLPTLEELDIEPYIPDHMKEE